MRTLRGLRSNPELQRLADADVADNVVALAVQGIQRGLGFFCGAIFQLGEFKAAFAVELVFDYVLGRLGHGHTCLFGALVGSANASLS